MDKNKVIQSATKYVQKGQFDKAIKEYQRIIDEDPRDIRVLLKIGELHQKRGDNKEAATTLLRVAEAYSNDGFFLKAAAVYKQVLKLNPALLEVNLKLAELYQQLGLMSDAMQQYQLVAAAYEKQGNQKASLGLLKKLVELEPDNAASRVRLAEAYANENHPQDAIAELTKVANQLKQSARHDEFVKVAERLLFLDPNNLQLSQELARMYLTRSDPKRALAKLQVCFKADPQDIDTLILLAQTFLDLGQQAKTISVYKELAKIYADKGRREEELATWRRVLLLAPDDAEAMQATGQMPQPPPRPVPAPRSSAPAPAPRSSPPSRSSSAPGRTSTEPRAGDVQKLLAETDVYLKYGLHEKAGDHLRRILEAAPESLPAHQKAKELCLLLGDASGAAQELATCARICVKQGDLAEAKVYVEQLRELEPSHAGLRELEGQLGDVTELPEIGEDEAILVDPQLEAMDAMEATVEASMDDDSSQLLVDEPGLEADFAGDEALLVPEQPLASQDEAMLVEGDEPLSAVSASTPTSPDDEIIDDQSELDSAALAAAGVEEHTNGALSAFMSAAGAPQLQALEEEEEGWEATEVGVAEAPEPAPPPARPQAVLVPPPPSPPSARPLPPSAKSVVPSAKSSPPKATAPPPKAVAPPAPVHEEEPGEIAEAEFFIEQGLFDEATEALAHLRALGRADLQGRVQSLEQRLREAQGGAGAEATATAVPALEVVGDAGGEIDLAAELEEEFAKNESAEVEDFQYSVEDVLSEFKKGVERVVGPGEVDAHYELGIAYREMGLIDEAISEFEVALRGAEGKPREADCLVMLGVGLATKGDFIKATKAFERALQSSSLKPEGRLNVYFEIGSAREAAGDAAGALDAFEKVSKVDPAFRDVAAALTRVRAARTGPRAGDPAAQQRSKKVGYL